MSHETRCVCCDEPISVRSGAEVHDGQWWCAECIDCGHHKGDS